MPIIKDIYTPHQIEIEMNLVENDSLSYDMVQRYVEMLENGSAPPEIRVSNGIVIEGHHRFIAGRIFGIEPAQQQWSAPSSLRGLNWSDIIIETTDWGGR